MTQSTASATGPLSASHGRVRGRGAYLRRALLGVACGSVAALAILVLRHGFGAAEPLPVLGTVPEFRLIAGSGEPFETSSVDGRIWIADFVFTHCPSLCPALSSHMAQLQRDLAADGRTDVRLVTFTVDPVSDTPAVLREYSTHFAADPAQWSFVTGDHAALYALIGDGFHLAVAERPPVAAADGEGLITHSDRFVLVDRARRIRGYYHGTDADSLRQLLRDLRRID